MKIYTSAKTINMNLEDFINDEVSDGETIKVNKGREFTMLTTKSGHQYMIPMSAGEELKNAKAKIRRSIEGSKQRRSDGEELSVHDVGAIKQEMAIKN